MSLINLYEFGLNLSGRPVGKSSYSVIRNNNEGPYELDFTRVMSVGSSFSDEVVGKLANDNGGSIVVINANRVIRKCLDNLKVEKGIDIEYRNVAARESD